MTPAQDRAAEPSIEQKQAELLAAGWTRISATLWRSPDYGLFTGPHGAWMQMKAERRAAVAAYEAAAPESAEGGR